MTMKLCDPCETGETVRVVMVRNGETEWNLRKLFTGWYDTRLSLTGKQEARNAGRILKAAKYEFDVVYASVLTRAEQTAHLILEELGQPSVPIVKSWRLNERHYGNLTGLSEAEADERQVRMCRTSYDIPPPMMLVTNRHYKEIVNDKRYRSDPPRSAFPMGESLKVAMERALPFWERTIASQVKARRRVLIVAHDCSLKAIIMSLDSVPAAKITKLHLPKARPFVYALDCGNLKPVAGGSMVFLGDANPNRKCVECKRIVKSTEIQHENLESIPEQASASTIDEPVAEKEEKDEGMFGFVLKCDI